MPSKVGGFIFGQPTAPSSATRPDALSRKMGDLDNPDVAGKLNKIRQVVRTTTNSNSGLRDKLKSVTEINNKLAQSYDVSLRIIVDVSKLLNQYITFFNEIDEMIAKLDSTASDGLTGEYVKYINRLTSENIDKMTTEFKNQLSSIVPMFDRNNIPTKNLTEYSELLDQINREAKETSMRIESTPPVPSRGGDRRSAKGARKRPGSKKN